VPPSSALSPLILVLATNSVGLSATGADTNWYSGIQGLFGQPKTDSQSEIKANAGAIIAFVLLILGLVLALLASLLPMLKKAEKFAGFLGLGGSVLLIVAGILIFCEVPMFCGTQGVDVSGSASFPLIGTVSYKYILGGGWIVAGILAVVGGGVAFLPSLFAFLAKKK
jgi:hypothetical protein